MFTALSRERHTRRDFLAACGTSVLAARASTAASKPMRGIFIIMATPYTEAKSLDYEDLAREVDFMDRSGVQGMVWPQMASEYSKLTRAERMEGMRILARAAKGKRPALVLGVQGATTDAALEFARAAEALEPDAMIAMPPTEAASLDDYRRYFRALAGVTKRPFFIQTTGGAKKVEPAIDLLVGLANEFPDFGYIKEEYQPVAERMAAMAKHRPPIKSIFSGAAGKGLMYEMRLGYDGTMPGAPYSDVYARIWGLYQSGKHDEARDVFAKLLLMVNLDQELPGVRQYVMRKRGIFKTTMSRQLEVSFSPQQTAEIDFNLAALRPYMIPGF
jgi:4-hydroxy-tetrahydrodipicolinate synthase